MTLPYEALAVVFGAGAVVAELRALGKELCELKTGLDDIRVEFRAAHEALTAMVGDLRERTSSLEAFRDFIERNRT